MKPIKKIVMKANLIEFCLEKKREEISQMKNAEKRAINERKIL